jgi:hypothetical protein
MELGRGDESTTMRYFTGYIDEVAFWDYARYSDYYFAIPTMPYVLSTEVKRQTLMMFRRGDAAGLPTLYDGEPFIELDTGKLHVGAFTYGVGGGTGDFSGPAGATADDIVVFNGATGKTGKDGGTKIADLAPAANGVTGGDSHDHVSGDGDPITAPAIDSGAATDGQVLTADGAGGAAWEDLPGNNLFIDQAGGTADTYGVLGGARNGVNTHFIVSQGAYTSGNLLVYLNGQLQTQGTAEAWVETDPATGTFDFATAPEATDEITVIYGSLATGGGGGVIPAATGGTESDVGGYHIHKFTTDGTLEVTRGGLAEVLIIAGGGGGGGTSGDNVAGGGGAGGGGLSMGIMALRVGSLAVVVGAGGAGGANNVNGLQGDNSSFNGVTAIGGGGGRHADDPTPALSDGGSAGGASGSSGAAAGSKQQPNADNGPLVGYGGAGGTKNDAAGGSFAGGGGGGAGGDASGRTAGVGKVCYHSGAAVTYAAGGYGQGTANDVNADASGAANTGDGGNGAAKGAGHTAGSGGSGIVVIRYIP